MSRLVCMIVALALIALTASAKKPKWHELEGYTFDMYRRDFKKPYGPSDKGFEQRRANFEQNVAHIKKLNSDATRSWKAGVNMFTDMSTAEFKAFNKARRTNKKNLAAATKVHEGFKAGEESNLPLTVDWRNANPRVLTAVKHQGSCGSCWAHSAVESIESQYALLTGMLPVLSVAQINSCTPNVDPWYCGGCDGGDYIAAWNYLSNATIVRPDVLKSVTENWAYPIPVRDWFFDTQPSNYSTSACFDVTTMWTTPATSWFAELTQAGVSGYGLINCNNQTGGPAAQKALRDVGPQSVSVAAGNWQWYESGVFMNTNSSGSDNEWGVDHAVQMVGYGYDKELDKNYWIVRNSWSTLWGEDGFIRLYRATHGQEEPCSPAEYGPVCGTSGVLSEVAYPIVFEATPTKFG